MRAKLIFPILVIFLFTLGLTGFSFAGEREDERNFFFEKEEPEFGEEFFFEEEFFFDDDFVFAPKFFKPMFVPKFFERDD
jgi:hypothetical protein